MLLAALEPGKEMAIANFFLAIFCLFTVALPLLLITRGDKTESNRDFLAATVNPWSQIVKEAEPSRVVISESDMTSSVQLETTLNVISEQCIEPFTDQGEVISLERKESVGLDEISTQISSISDDLAAA